MWVILIGNTLVRVLIIRLKVDRGKKAFFFKIGGSVKGFFEERQSKKRKNEKWKMKTEKW